MKSALFTSGGTRTGTALKGHLQEATHSPGRKEKNSTRERERSGSLAKGSKKKKTEKWTMALRRAKGSLHLSLAQEGEKGKRAELTGAKNGKLEKRKKQGALTVQPGRFGAGRRLMRKASIGVKHVQDLEECSHSSARRLTITEKKRKRSNEGKREFVSRGKRNRRCDNEENIGCIRMKRWGETPDQEKLDTRAY